MGHGGSNPSLSAILKDQQMTSVTLGIVSFMLIVQSIVSVRYILKCISQRKAMDNARYQLSGVDGLLPHDTERIARARRILIEGLE